MTDAPPAIEIRGLTKRFLNTLALDDVDLTIMTARKSMRSWARTAPASRRLSKFSPGSISPTQAKSS